MEKNAECAQPYTFKKQQKSCQHSITRLQLHVGVSQSSSVTQKKRETKEKETKSHTSLLPSPAWKLLSFRTKCQRRRDNKNQINTSSFPGKKS